MRRSQVVAAALGCAFFGHSGPSSAAPPKKQCIAAAESGQQLRSGGHLIEARKALAACTASICPAVVRRDCGRWIEEIDAAQPSITVKLEEAAGDEAADGRVLVDSEPLLRAAGGRSTPLDPGAHKLVWVRETGGNVEREVVIREGERNRLIVLRVALASKPAADPIEPPPPPPRARGPLPYVVGGVGLALAGAGGIFWGIGVNDRSTLSTSCAAAHACSQHDIDASRTKLIVGDVLMAASVLAVAGAIFLFVTHDGSRTVLSGIPASRPFVVRTAASSDRAEVPVN